MNIAVFCSSSNHIADNYKQVGFRLGEMIAESGNTLVYGGATGGLMDSVSEGAACKNGQIIGVIPQAVIRMNRQSSLPTQLITVETMRSKGNHEGAFGYFCGFARKLRNLGRNARYSNFCHCGRT